MQQTESIEIVVNGVTRRAQTGWNLLELIRSLGMEPERVAVELDREIVKRAEWAATPVHPGARLEIVHFVGGG